MKTGIHHFLLNLTLSKFNAFSIKDLIKKGRVVTLRDNPNYSNLKTGGTCVMKTQESLHFHLHFGKKLGKLPTRPLAVGMA